MDVLKQRRKKLVRKLRECAKLAEVQLERDDASRSKVRALFDRVAAKGCAVATAKAATACEEYETTWGNTNADKAEESAELKVLRLRGKSFLFSYNWDFFNKDFPDGTLRTTSHALVARPCEALPKPFVLL